MPLFKIIRYSSFTIILNLSHNVSSEVENFVVKQPYNRSVSPAPLFKHFTYETEFEHAVSGWR